MKFIYVRHRLEHPLTFTLRDRFSYQYKVPSSLSQLDTFNWNWQLFTRLYPPSYVGCSDSTPTLNLDGPGSRSGLRVQTSRRHWELIGTKFQGLFTSSSTLKSMTERVNYKKTRFHGWKKLAINTDQCNVFLWTEPTPQFHTSLPINPLNLLGRLLAKVQWEGCPDLSSTC